MKLLMLIVLFTSCAHRLQKDHVVTSPNDPDKVCLKPVTELKGTTYLVTSNLKKGTGTTLSFLATGLAYTGDVVYFIGTFGGTGLLCSSGGHNHPSRESECYESLWGSIPMMNLGGKTFKSTRHMRCPEIIQEAEILKSVAACYASKGYLIEAEKQMKIIEDSSIFRNCVR